MKDKGEIMEKDIGVWVNTAISTINLISLIVIFRSVKNLLKKRISIMPIGEMPKMNVLF